MRKRGTTLGRPSGTWQGTENRVNRAAAERLIGTLPFDSSDLGSVPSVQGAGHMQTVDLKWN